MAMDEGTLDDAAAGHPARLGPYQLLRVLGSGAMGTVYLAQLVEDRPHAKAGSRVAVKVLHPELTVAGRSLKRFLQEGSLGSRIRSPAVARTLDFDSVTDGGATRHFLVLEHVEGRSLRELAKELRLVPEPLVRDVARQVARGLAAIHDAGIIHRDVKPENVLLTAEHAVKLTDLGVARLLEEGGLTAAGEFVGTPHYAAPEQFRGEAVGPAADLYAVGVMLHELVTGARPFVAGDRHALMRLHLEHVAPKAGQLNPQVSPFLEEVITVLLEKDPRLRFASAAALAEALELGEASAWWVARERSLRQAGVIRRARLPRAGRFLGREAELARLHEALEDARSRRGGLVLVVGEAGGGKSRLVDELARRVETREDHARVLHSHHAPGGAGGALGALERGLVSHLGATLPGPVRRRLKGAGESLASWLEQRGSSEPGDASGNLGRLVRALADEGPPVLWIVEDLHFASVEDRRALAALGELAAGERVLIVATTRPQPEADLATLLRGERSRRLELPRLSAGECVQLVREAARDEDVVARLGQRLAERSGGNPFFVLELLRDLVARGVIDEVSDGALRLREGAPGVFVPDSLRDLLLGRLASLGDADRELLDVAAVQGFRFDPDLVARVLRRDRLDVLQAFSRLERRDHLVRGAGRAVEFDHHLLQELLEHALLPALAAALHGALARAFVEREDVGSLAPEQLSGEASAFLAHHLLASDEPALGLPHALPAVRQLRRVHDPERTEALAARAVEALPPGPAILRCELLQARAHALHLLGRRAEEAAILEDALAAARATGSTARESQVLRDRGILLSRLGRYEESASDYALALAVARSAGDRKLELSALRARVALDVQLGDTRAGERGEEALALARELGDRSAIAGCLASLGSHAFTAGRLGDAGRLLADAIELGRAGGETRFEAAATGRLGHVRLYQGELSEARRLYERMIELYREAGDVHGVRTQLTNLGAVLLHEGRLLEARRRFEEDLVSSRHFADAYSAALVETLLARVDVLEGRLDDAERRARGSLDEARRMNLGLLSFTASSALGAAALGGGRLPEARSHLEDALSAARAARSRLPETIAATALAGALLEIGEEARAKELLEPAAAFVEQEGLGLEPGPLAMALLSLAGARDPAAAVVEAHGSVPMRAHAHVALHEACLRVSAPPGTHLDDALALLRSMSAHLQGEDVERFWRFNPVARRALSMMQGH